MKFSVALSLINLVSFNFVGWFRISGSVSIQVAYLYEYIINSEVPLIENGDSKLKVENSNLILTIWHVHFLAISLSMGESVLGTFIYC
jgi:hypothetical protein